VGIAAFTAAAGVFAGPHVPRAVDAEQYSITDSTFPNNFAKNFLTKLQSRFQLCPGARAS